MFLVLFPCFSVLLGMSTVPKESKELVLPGETALIHIRLGFQTSTNDGCQSFARPSANLDHY
jgi:hypothetical protein